MMTKIIATLTIISFVMGVIFFLFDEDDHGLAALSCGLVGIALLVILAVWQAL